MEAIRDNDQTKNMARPAVIVAAIRSGGTFLTHCLSNHTQIFCDRGEPLHHMSIWSMTVGQRKLLAALLNQTGYAVSMCRLTYWQAFQKDVWRWLVKRQPLVIWLYRENILRQAISVYLNQQVRRAGELDRPAHTFDDPVPARCEIDPALYLKYARGMAEQNVLAKKRLAQIKQVYTLMYAEVVGGEAVSAIKLPMKTTRGLCEFLGVRYEALFCDLKRINPQPLREMIANWETVEAAIRKSEFSAQLEAGA